jgi:hypothetical protein
VSILYGTLLLVWGEGDPEGAKLLGYDRQTVVIHGSKIMYMMNAKLYDNL